MEQLTMFKPPTGQELAEKGIKQAVTNANRKHDGWSQKAFELLRIYLLTKNTPFLCEDFRAWCEGKLPNPPSKRAFGGIIQRAAKEGVIKRVAYQSVSNPKAHCAMASAWLKI